MRSVLLATFVVALCTPPAPAAATESLDPLVQAVAERVMTSNQVAAAKWGTNQPIDDPAREQQVLNAVANRSEELGIDPEAVKGVFRDQIEASKLVQRALHQHWNNHPDQQPMDRPALSEVRPTIDRLNSEILLQLRETQQLRGQPSCTSLLTGASQHIQSELHLSTLHQQGMTRATQSICT